MEKTKQKVENEFFKRSLMAFGVATGTFLVQWIVINLAFGSMGQFSWSSVGAALLLVTAVGLDVGLTSFNYQVSHYVQKSRFEAFLSMFSITKWIEIIARVFVGACLAGISLAALGVGGSIKRSSDGSDQYLNVTQIGGVLFGALCGFMIAMRRTDVVSFPLVHLPFVAICNNETFPLFRRGFGQTVTAILIFLPIFGWKGIRFCNTIASAFDVPLDRESFLSLLSPSFFLPVFVAGFAVFNVHGGCFVLFQHFQTKHIILPVGSANLDIEPTVRLYHGLTLVARPLFRYLAWHDMNFLAEHDVLRRKELFSLSNPGGNPHNWNAISSVCLDVIQSFITKIDPTAQRKFEGPTEKPAAEQGIITPGILKSRNVTNTYQTSPVKSAAVEKKEKMTYLDELKSKVTKKIMEIPLIVYLFGINETAELQNALYESLPVKLSVHTLGHLCSVAKEEDDFGVVQKDLSAIVKTFLELHTALEKQTRIPIHDRKPLLTTVRAALYRITNTYGKHIMSLSFDEASRSQVAAYLNLRMMG